MKTIDVKAGEASDTATGVDGGIDVAFTLFIDGEALRGEVTLRAPGGSLRYGAWGQPDHWVDGRTLARLRDLPVVEYRDALAAIETATSPVAAAYAAER